MPNPSSKVTSYTHPISGEEYQRLINTNRAKTYAVKAIRYDDDDGTLPGLFFGTVNSPGIFPDVNAVPTEPPEDIKQAGKKLEKTLLGKLQGVRLPALAVSTFADSLNTLDYGTKTDVDSCCSSESIHFRRGQIA